MAIGYILMHKGVPVVELTLDHSGNIASLEDVITPDHAPVGTLVDGIVSEELVSKWWSKRSIPASRSGLRNILEVLDIPTPSYLLESSLGLSLSDHYWIKPRGSQLRYKDVNFYENPFSEDVGSLLFGHAGPEGVFDLTSPDNTSDGNMMKKWKIVNGQRFLIKSASGFMVSEVVNELAASMLADSLHIDHASYGLVFEGDKISAATLDFIGLNTELVSASRILRGVGKGVDLYRSYVDACSDLGVDVVPSLDRMITFDYLIGNSDRHLGNFGLIRDPDTLEYTGVAPLFDNGASMGYDRMPYDVHAGMVLPCRPFRVSWEEQLKLVTDLSFLDEDALLDGISRCAGFLHSFAHVIGEDRCEGVCAFLDSRLKSVLRML